MTKDSKLEIESAKKNSPHDYSKGKSHDIIIPKPMSSWLFFGMMGVGTCSFLFKKIIRYSRTGL